jgi:hypothetical protein
MGLLVYVIISFSGIEFIAWKNVKLFIDRVILQGEKITVIVTVRQKMTKIKSKRILMSTSKNPLKVTLHCPDSSISDMTQIKWITMHYQRWFLRLLTFRYAGF